MRRGRIGLPSPQLREARPAAGPASLPYLPVAQHNCRECGERTCLAFAVKVVNEMEGQKIGIVALCAQFPNIRRSGTSSTISYRRPDMRCPAKGKKKRLF